MIDVLLKTDSRYPVDRKRVRKAATEILAEENITTDCQISVYVCGDRKMRTLNKKYRNINGTTDVLSFGSENDKPFVTEKSNILYLGDIAISYPEARKNAMNNELLVDDEIDNLVKHGILHLLGKHHEQ